MRRVLNATDTAIMREAGQAAACILKKIGRLIKPGVCTKDIERFFESELARFPGMSAAFKGFSGFPAALCVSINDEVIHGIPSPDRLIAEGDLVSVDLGIKFKDLFVDTARTYFAGRVATQAKKLAAVCLRALEIGIRAARIGNTTGDIGAAIQSYVQSQGFSVVRQFVGHGIGEALHLEPEVPNFGKAGEGQRFTEGMAIAIEPMIAAGGYEIEIAADGWTARTKDRRLAAHFEHTVMITRNGPYIITG